MKFFRKIRYELMEKNKTGKYLKYAMGEIILVVTGIVIALNINNWNEDNKTNKIETIYIKNILRDLDDQLMSIEGQIEGEREFFTISSEILNDYYASKILSLDSTFFDKATRLTARKTFVINDPTYTDLISSGNINVIKNNTQKSKMIKYYQHLELVEKIMQNNNSNLVDLGFCPTYNELGYIALTAFDEIKSLNQTDKLQDLSIKLFTEEKELKMLNVISGRHAVATIHLSFLENLKDRTLALIKTLELKD